MKRKLIAFILTIVAILAIVPSMASAAAAGGTVVPCWQNTGSVSCKIGFPDDGYGYAEAYVMGHPTVNKIQGDVYVYRQVICAGLSIKSIIVYSGISMTTRIV